MKFQDHQSFYTFIRSDAELVPHRDCKPQHNTHAHTFAHALRAHKYHKQQQYAAPCTYVGTTTPDRTMTTNEKKNRSHSHKCDCVYQHQCNLCEFKRF